MNVIAKLKNLDPVNKAYIEKYIRHLKLKQLKQKTIDTKVWRVYTFLTWSKFSDAQEV
ncbi:MAG: Tyrosine recombinase xerC, partial [Methanoculleus marisnigri]